MIILYQKVYQKNFIITFLTIQIDRSVIVSKYTFLGGLKVTFIK